jgi:dUTP pyrophosphatase
MAANEQRRGGGEFDKCDLRDVGQFKVIAVKIRRLVHAEGLPLPAYHSEHAAGMDLVAALAHDAPCTLAPGERALIPTGFAVEIPRGFEGQIRPRSGLALKVGVTVLNAPGTIDADYRGEVQVVLVNHGANPYVVSRGARIAQLAVSRVERILLSEVGELSGTSRGEQGFGSTGVTSRADQGE